MLDLDDDSSVTRAVPFSGGFPASESKESVSVGSKSNQVFQASLQMLESIMAGFSVPDEEKFQTIISHNVEQFLKTLKDPSLPLLETKVATFIICRININ